MHRRRTQLTLYSDSCNGNAKKVRRGSAHRYPFVSFAVLLCSFQKYFDETSITRSLYAVRLHAELFKNVRRDFRVQQNSDGTKLKGFEKWAKKRRLPESPSFPKGYTTVNFQSEIFTQDECADSRGRMKDKRRADPLYRSEHRQETRDPENCTKMRRTNAKVTSRKEHRREDVNSPEAREIFSIFLSYAKLSCENVIFFSFVQTTNTKVKLSYIIIK